MSRFIVITGGAKSGKSRQAVKLAQGFGDKIVFVATCLLTDDMEMRRKIEIHRQQRPAHWITIEGRQDVEHVIQEQGGSVQGLIVDSLSLMVSSVLIQSEAETLWQPVVQRLCSSALSAPCPVIVVTDEVGWGLVPENALGRRFREALGAANQEVVSKAHEAYLMVSGVALKLKG